MVFYCIEPVDPDFLSWLKSGSWSWSEKSNDYFLRLESTRNLSLRVVIFVWGGIKDDW